MFLRAGFRPNHSVICHARVRLVGRTTVCTAKLIRFYPSGDLAWWSRQGNFLVWGDKIRINNHDGLRPWMDCHGDAVDIDAFHRKLEAAREAGCLAVAA